MLINASPLVWELQRLTAGVGLFSAIAASSNNHFDNNLTSVAVSAPISARYNDWRNNHWDNYEGFDLDGNGIGDLPHDIYLYADRIWMDRPTTQFFRSTPTMEFIDFIERLAPFSDPELILSDPAPRTR
ncbi:hypothetical protein DJ031_09135 [bacterium endosymbiont of Escarpia laminata]|nr:MAG: hypothetical protein DJ031_09135 [bacterium endosymbiont of Escarpia laminata]